MGTCQHEDMIGKCNGLHPTELHESIRDAQVGDEYDEPAVGELYGRGERRDDIPRTTAEGFDNSTEACRHCPTPEVHPKRVGGLLVYEAEAAEGIRIGPFGDMCSSADMHYDHLNPITQAQRRRTYGE